MKRYIIKIRYKDKYTRGKWASNTSEFYAKDKADARKKVIACFGLDECEDYEIVSIEEEGE